MSPDVVALVIVAALPYADRALDKLAADRKDARAAKVKMQPKGAQQ